MYHYVEDKDFLKCMKNQCYDIVNQLVISINKDTVMKVRAELIGSGAKNLVTQNEKESIDLDYNIIIGVKYVSAYDERKIKEYVRKQFDTILKKNGWGDCKDSRSVLSTEKGTFVKGNKTAFSIDLAIVHEDESGSYRLIHEKSGIASQDRYFWNKVPDSKGLQKKVSDIKANKLWDKIRKEYLRKKNMYLSRNDSDHPSYVVYIETINEIYSKLYSQGIHN